MKRINEQPEVDNSLREGLQRALNSATLILFGKSKRDRVPYEATMDGLDKYDYIGV